ncbi:hypothetical protein N7478_009741 [Penicillium angulare]|uniref:uncharacterized protein n=1 Tax=Penicillium angulare TaxID=116970 RepID=UPI0025408A2A|nr:uncharacterized protein N7478_009741 [Penicillium angulare]KAJ5266933.1 hypothetical protein N7478_009741 [Penicillium angulare]
MAISAANAVSELKLALPGQNKVISPDAASEYEENVARPWSQTCWTSAAGYVFLSNTQELTKALEIVKKSGSKFTIRTTGHNPNYGFSSADETSVVLDIRQLSSKELSLDKTVAQVGSGSTWGEVYTWLEEQKLSAIGGRDQDVGIGGFLLGGGMGALPNLHGLGADGIKNFEVLLADGQLINSNSKENSDLYRALKGGGSNFGIVTRFDLETHPLINIQYTINLYKAESYIEIIKATIAVQEAMEADPKIGLFTNFNNGFVAVGLFYADTPVERPSAFKPFDKLDQESLMMAAVPTTNGTILSLARAMGMFFQKLIYDRRFVGSVTTGFSQDLYEEIHKLWTETCKSLPADHVLHYTIQPFGKGGLQAGKDRGGNIMGHEDAPQCWWVFTCEWPNEGNDDAAKKAVDTMIETVQSLAKERELLLNFQCMSFASCSQKVLGSYGAENVKKMQEVAAKYDPEGVFQRLQYGGFLLRDNV